jgi:hypothetical protein
MRLLGEMEASMVTSIEEQLKAQDDYMKAFLAAKEKHDNLEKE